MLTRIERVVAKALVDAADGRESFLISESSLAALCRIKPKDVDKFRKAISSLSLGGYYDLIRCGRDGEELLCVIPKSKLLLYRRERRDFASGIIFKILLAVLGSVAAFLATKILYGLF